MAFKLYIKGQDGRFAPVKFYRAPYNDAPLRELITKNVSAIKNETQRATEAETALGQRIDNFKEKDPEFEKWKNGISLALGHNAKSVNYSTAIGENASAQFAGAIALGNNALVTKGREITLGGNNKSDTNTFFSIPSPSATKDKRANFYEQSLDGTVRIPNLPNKESDGLGDLQPYLAELAGGGALRPLYEAMPNVKWNPETKMYDVWKNYGGISVSEPEMKFIYNSSYGNPFIGGYCVSGGRAIIPRISVNPTYSNANWIFEGSHIELIAFSAFDKKFYLLNPQIYTLPKLKTVYVHIKLNRNATYLCESLQFIRVLIDKASTFSFNLKLSKDLNYDSLRFLPDNVIGDTYSNTTTITVHSTPYSLLTGTATDEQYEATGHTQSEWQKIVTDSTAKGITFTKAL